MISRAALELLQGALSKFRCFFPTLNSSSGGAFFLSLSLLKDNSKTHRERCKVTLIAKAPFKLHLQWWTAAAADADGQKSKKWGRIGW